MHTAWRDILGPYDRWARGTLDQSRVPRYVWDCTPPADLDAMSKRRALDAQADFQQAQALKMLAAQDLGSGEIVDLQAWCAERKIPTKKGKPRVAPPPIPADAPPAAERKAA
jgi:hypothetical protein